jgi:sec-independent protein translocase protein TatA
MSVGALEIFLVLFIVLLILGPRRIVELGRALGRGVRDFKLEFGRKRDGEQLPGGEHDEKPPGSAE